MLVAIIAWDMKNEQKVDNIKAQKAIVSLVTPVGEGGIGKIIVSGLDALSVVNTAFQGKGIADLREAASHKLYYGYIQDRGQKIDEVIVNIIKQEDSFTGEDVAEVNCHGGIRVLMRIHECLQSAGAVDAPWNALLARSLANDRLDFVQKEAIQELIEIQTKLGAKVLLDQYTGALSGALNRGLEIIEEIRAGVSGDISPHPSSVSSPVGVSGSGGGSYDLLQKNDAFVSTLTNLIRELLETASFGMALTTPRVLVILGKPNVGKSTIINAILGEERMLVHHEPGTTRDYVSEVISVEGIPFELVDTAGIRATTDKLEAMSIEMTQEQLQRADKVIVVFDNSRPFDKEDDEILRTLHAWLMSKTSGDLPPKTHTHAIIPVVNKCDLPVILDKRRIVSALQRPVCALSALNKDGFDDLNKRLIEEFDTVYKPMRPVVFNKRQYQLLAKADSFIEKNRECLITRQRTSEASHVINGLKKIFTACLEGQE